jgi:hypothetical protein
MPRNPSGTYTLPSGNPVEAGTLIEANWANTTLNDIANELTDSLSRSGEGGMLAPFRLADGLQATPGIAWLNEPSTGFYRAGSGEMWGVVSGTQVLQYTANGVLIPASRTFTNNGNTTLGGTLAVTGASTLTGALTANGGVGTTTLSTSGLATLNSASVTGNLSVGGTLTLTGGLTLNGNVTVGDSSADTLTINSTITSNMLFTDNTYDIGASGATRPRHVYVAGNGVFGGTLGVTGVLTASAGLTGNVTGNLTGNVTGNISGGTVAGTTGTFSSNVTVGGTLGVTGATTLSSTLGVTGAITASGGVSGNVTGNLTGNVTGSISGGTVAGSTGAFSSNVTVGGTLGVTGVATLTANPVLSGGTANGVLYLNGSNVATSGSTLTFDGANLTTPAEVYRTSATSFVRVSGGDGAGSGANLLVFGQSHATTPGRAVLTATGTGYLQLNSNGGSILLDSSGNVGIGTSSPASKLHINSGTSDQGVLIESTDTRALIGFKDNTTVTNPLIGGVADDLVVRTNNVESMRVTSAGLVGIGTSSPGTKLSVVGVQASPPTLGTAAGGFSILNNTGVYGTYVGVNPSTGDTWFQAMRNDAATAYNIVLQPSGGNVGIGTSSPAYKFDLDAGTGVNIAARFVARSTGTIFCGTNDTGIFDSDGSNGWSVNEASDFARVYTNGLERLRVDSAGNLGLGVTPSAWASGASVLQVGNRALLSAGSTNTIVGNNFFDDGSAKYIQTGFASFYRQNSGEHAWFTAPSGTAGGTISFTQAMTLTSGGDLLVGTTSSSAKFHAKATSAADVIYRLEPFSNSYASKLLISSTGSGDGGIRYGTGGGNNLDIFSYGDMRFYCGTANIGGTVGDERARITSGGDLLVGTDNTSATTGAGFKFAPGTNPRLSIVTGSSTSATSISLYSTGAGAYRFFVDPSGTIYATVTTISSISDQRYKENIRDLDVGLDAVMALKPRKFDWKEGKGKDIKDDRGFIAQEFEQVFPDLVDEWKDPAPEGEEPYKSVRQDLIPVLVKAIQEQQAMIEDLKAKVAALEAK